MRVPQLVIVGADKGGVGKTMIARTLMDYYKHHSVEHRAFDTEAPLGVLKRFYPDRAEVVDLIKSDGQMRVFDTLRAEHITLIDVRAGLLSAMLRTLGEIGFMDGVKDGKLKISVLHVLGSTQASFDEIQSTSQLAEGSRHLLVTNHINDTTFPGFSSQMRAAGTGVIDIGKLNELAADYVDKSGSSFEAFVANNSNSAVMRGYVKSWLGRVFKQYDLLQMSQLQ